MKNPEDVAFQWGKTTWELLTGTCLALFFICCRFGWSCAASSACALEQIQQPRSELVGQGRLSAWHLDLNLWRPTTGQLLVQQVLKKHHKTKGIHKKNGLYKLTMTTYINLMGSWMICLPQFSTEFSLPNYQDHPSSGCGEAPAMAPSCSQWVLSRSTGWQPWMNNHGCCNMSQLPAWAKDSKGPQLPMSVSRLLCGPAVTEIKTDTATALIVFSWLCTRMNCQLQSSRGVQTFWLWKCTRRNNAKLHTIRKDDHQPTNAICFLENHLLHFQHGSPIASFGTPKCQLFNQQRCQFPLLLFNNDQPEG